MLARVRAACSPRNPTFLIAFTAVALCIFFCPMIMPWYIVDVVPGAGSPSYSVNFLLWTTGCAPHSKGNHTNPCVDRADIWRDHGAVHRGLVYDVTGALVVLSLASTLLVFAVAGRREKPTRSRWSALGNVSGIAAPLFIALSVIVFASAHVEAFDKDRRAIQFDDGALGPWSSLIGSAVDAANTKRSWGPFGMYSAVVLFPLLVFIAWVVWDGPNNAAAAYQQGAAGDGGDDGGGSADGSCAAADGPVQLQSGYGSTSSTSSDASASAGVVGAGLGAGVAVHSGGAVHAGGAPDLLSSGATSWV